MAISIRPLHRSYCPLSCACVGARRAAGGVRFTIVVTWRPVGKFRSQIFRGSTRPLRTRRKIKPSFIYVPQDLLRRFFLTCVNHVWTLLVVVLSHGGSG